VLPEKKYRSFRLNSCEMRILAAGDISPHLPDNAAILGTVETVFGEGSASYQEPTGAAMTDPTSETDRSALRLVFDRHLLLQFRESVIISDAGLLAYRELEDTLCLTDAAANMLSDARTSKNGRHQR